MKALGQWLDWLTESISTYRRHHKAGNWRFSCRERLQFLTQVLVEHRMLHPKWEGIYSENMNVDIELPQILITNRHLGWYLLLSTWCILFFFGSNRLLLEFARVWTRRWRLFLILWRFLYKVFCQHVYQLSFCCKLVRKNNVHLPHALEN